MAPTRKPVKVLSDLLTRKQIIKQDEFGNIVFNVSGALGNGHVSSSLPLTASNAFFVQALVNSLGAFTNIPVITSSINTYNVYDIDQAFHAIDSAITSVNDSASVNAYTRLRFAEVNYFDPDGTKTIILPATGATPQELRFHTGSIDYLNVQIYTKESGTYSWVNDLVSAETYISGSSNDEVWVSISAPALSDVDQYKLLVVNENPNDYVII